MYIKQAFGLVIMSLTLVFAPFDLKAGHGKEPEDHEFSEMSLKELMSLEVFNAATLLPTEQAKAPGSVYSFDTEDFTRLGIRRLDD